MILYIANLSDFAIDEYEKYYSMLDCQRRESVSRMRNENDKKRSVLGEALARKGISSALGIDEAEIRVKRSENGKPYCENADVYFSISHSKSIVVCAIGGSELGADVEYIRDVEARVLRFACTENETKKYFPDLNIGDGAEKLPPEYKREFFRIWTAKEAYGKFLGKGISAMRNLELSEISSNLIRREFDDYTLALYCEEKDKNIKEIWYGE